MFAVLRDYVVSNDNLQIFVSENLSFQSDNAILHDGVVTKVHFSMIVLLCEKNELMNSFFFGHLYLIRLFFLE